MSLKKKLVSFIGCSLLAANLSGCFGFMIPDLPFSSKKYKTEEQRPSWIEEYYSYKKENINFEEKSKEDRKNYTIRYIEFPSYMHTTDNNDTAKIDYYDVKSDCKTPLIILSPILGGNNGESKIFAEYFANHGLACAIFHRPEDRFPTETGADFVQNLENILKQSIIDTRRAVDIFETFPDIDTNRIGSFGISMGGIKNSVLAGVDSRFKVNIFVMAGADIPYILEHTKEDKVNGEIKKAQNLLGENNLIQQLKEHLVTDPKNFAKYVDDDNALIYISLFDQVIPLENQKKLKNLIGHPETAYLLSGHYSAILYILPPWNYVQSTSLNFFVDRFSRIEEK